MIQKEDILKKERERIWYRERGYILKKKIEENKKEEIIKMQDKLIINSMIFVCSFIFAMLVFLAYINYKYDSSCGQTVDILLNKMGND